MASLNNPKIIGTGFINGLFLNNSVDANWLFVNDSDRIYPYNSAIIRIGDINGLFLSNSDDTNGLFVYDPDGSYSNKPFFIVLAYVS